MVCSLKALIYLNCISKKQLFQENDKTDVKVLSGRSDYNDKEKEIHVAVKAEIGMDEDENDAPFILKVEIVGHRGVLL